MASKCVVAFEGEKELVDVGAVFVSNVLPSSSTFHLLIEAHFEQPGGVVHSQTRHSLSRHSVGLVAGQDRFAASHVSVVVRFCRKPSVIIKSSARLQPVLSQSSASRKGKNVVLWPQKSKSIGSEIEREKVRGRGESADSVAQGRALCLYDISCLVVSLVVAGMRCFKNGDRRAI